MKFRVFQGMEPEKDFFLYGNRKVFFNTVGQYIHKLKDIFMSVSISYRTFLFI